MQPTDAAGKAGTVTVFDGRHQVAQHERITVRGAVLRLDQDLHDPRLCATIVDPLTFNGQVIETGVTSYRLAHARRVQAAN